MTEGGLRLPEPWPSEDERYTTRFVRLASGLRIRVVERGELAHAPVLFLHGWGCSAYEFCENIPAVAAAGRRAIAIDLKGHGWSDKPLDSREYTLESMSRSVVDAMDALGLACADLVGHSMGGRIALHVAHEYPERVAGLALISPVGIERARVRMLARLGGSAVLRPALPLLARRKLVALAVRATFGDRTPGEGVVDQFWLPATSREMLVAAQAALREFVWDAAPLEALRLRSIPLLAIFGSRDPLFEARPIGEIEALLPGARVVRIDGAGHVANLERPGIVNRALVTWLGERESVGQRAS